MFVLAFQANGCLLGIDDAHIFFTYAANLAEGRGLIYSQGVILFKKAYGLPNTRSSSYRNFLGNLIYPLQWTTLFGHGRQLILPVNNFV
jgi:hypothetical protein